MPSIQPRASRVPTRPWRLAPIRGAAAVAGILVCGLLATCGPRQGAPRNAAPVTAASGPLPGGPPPPKDGLAFPDLAAPWTPPMLSAGDLEGMAAALAGHSEVTVALGPRLSGATWELRAAALAAALSPGTRVSETVHAGLTEIVEPEAELLALRRAAPAASGRPRMAATLTLRMQPTGSAGPLLALDDVGVDLPRWQALPSASVGSCEPAMQALAAGQEAALMQLAPFLDHADGLLGRLYRAELQAFVPEFAASLKRYEGPAGAAVSEQETCGRAYHAHVQQYAACLTDAAAACPGTPKLVLVGGARIVAAEPTLAVSDRCPALVGRDYPAELQRLADAAAESAGAGLDRGWTVLADRLGTLTEVHAALEDVCVTRRRRFAAEDVAEARTRLARIGAALASADVRADGGRWTRRGEPLAVPGLGMTRALMGYEAGPGSVNAGIVADAHGLREFVLARSLCKAGHAATPMAAVVAAPGRGVEFFGFFYEEELFCGSLPPLRE